MTADPSNRLREEEGGEGIFHFSLLIYFKLLNTYSKSITKF